MNAARLHPTQIGRDLSMVSDGMTLDSRLDQGWSSGMDGRLINGTGQAVYGSA